MSQHTLRVTVIFSVGTVGGSRTVSFGVVVSIGGQAAYSGGKGADASVGGWVCRFGVRGSLDPAVLGGVEGGLGDGFRVRFGKVGGRSLRGGSRSRHERRVEMCR